MKNKLIKDLEELRDNALFESEEDEDTIEHVDMRASKVRGMLTEAIKYIHEH